MLIVCIFCVCMHMFTHTSVCVYIGVHMNPSGSRVHSRVLWFPGPGLRVSARSSQDGGTLRVGFTSTPQVPFDRALMVLMVLITFNRALMVLNSEYLGYTRG